jgi:periplasmic protein CpxP/Spy
MTTNPTRPTPLDPAVSLQGAALRAPRRRAGASSISAFAATATAAVALLLAGAGAPAVAQPQLITAVATADGEAPRQARSQGKHGGGHHAGYARHGGHAASGMSPMGGLGLPPLHARALDRVGASEAQKAQIAQIMQSARADLKAQREAGASTREQARALFAQPNVDARTAETLRQQLMAQQDQASQRMTQAMVEASRVLSVEQRQALVQQAEQWRAMQEQRRAEHMQRQQRGERGEHAPRGERRPMSGTPGGTI